MAEILNIAYHDVVVNGALGINCTPDRFENEINFLIRNSYEFLTCVDIASRILECRRLPEKCVSISFDDCLKSHCENVLTILKRYGKPATFFVPTAVLAGKLLPVLAIQILVNEIGAEKTVNAVKNFFSLHASDFARMLDPKVFAIGNVKQGEKEDRRQLYYVFCHICPIGLQQDCVDALFEEYIGEAQGEWVERIFMSKEDILELAGAGMEVASHSEVHPFLYSAEDARREAKKSREHFNELGMDVKTFGYPFGGRFSTRIQQEISQYYTSAWNYSNDRQMKFGPVNLFDMQRLSEASIFHFLEISNNL